MLQASASCNSALPHTCFCRYSWESLKSELCCVTCLARIGHERKVNTFLFPPLHWVTPRSLGVEFYSHFNDEHLARCHVTCSHWQVPGVLNVVTSPQWSHLRYNRQGTPGMLKQTHHHCTMGKLERLKGHQVEAHLKQFWSTFKSFLCVNWTYRHIEACLGPCYPRGRTLVSLKLLSNLPRDVEGDVGLGSHSALI